MHRSMWRQVGVGVAALGLCFSMSACGSDGTTPATAASGQSDARADAATTSPFGPLCSLVPKVGPGSVTAMAVQPVATAAASNPALSTFAAAVSDTGLAGALDSATGLTVFAPSNDAFKKIPDAELNALLADKEKLAIVLKHHVVDGKLSPAQVVGQHETLAGDTARVEGGGTRFRVDDTAKVVCGDVATSNATVYIVDTVLLPVM